MLIKMDKFFEYAEKYVDGIKEAIENYIEDPSISPDKKAVIIINIFSMICAITAAQPLPFADIFILTPLQTVMVYFIAKALNYPINQTKAQELVSYILGIIGYGFLAQHGVLALYKILVPILGSVPTIPVVYGFSAGIGFASKAIIDARMRDKTLSKEEIKRIQRIEKQRAEKELKSKGILSPNLLIKELENTLQQGQEFGKYRKTLKQLSSVLMQERVELEQKTKILSEYKEYFKNISQSEKKELEQYHERYEYSLSQLYVKKNQLDKELQKLSSDLRKAAQENGDLNELLDKFYETENKWKKIISQIEEIQKVYFDVLTQKSIYYKNNIEKLERAKIESQQTFFTDEDIHILKGLLQFIEHEKTSLQEFKSKIAENAELKRQIEMLESDAEKIIQENYELINQLKQKEIEFTQKEMEIEALKKQIDELNRQYQHLLNSFNKNRQHKRNAIVNRFLKCWPEVILTDKVIDDMVDRINNENIQNTLEKEIRNIIDNKTNLSNIKKIHIEGVFEVKFHDRYRMYFARNGNKIHLLRVGTKATQEQDIDWIRNNYKKVLELSNGNENRGYPPHLSERL